MTENAESHPGRNEFGYFHTIRVRYAEVDAQGVVFNAHYLTYFDCAITEFMRHVGYDYRGYVARTGNDFHLVKSLVEYFAPIHFDDEIEVGVRIGRIGRTSITFALGIFRKGDPRLLSRGEIVWVHVALSDHQTRPLPQEMTGLLAPAQGVS